MEIELFGRKFTRNSILMVSLGLALLIGAILAATRAFWFPLTTDEVQSVDAVQERTQSSFVDSPLNDPSKVDKVELNDSVVVERETVPESEIENRPGSQIVSDVVDAASLDNVRDGMRSPQSSMAGAFGIRNQNSGNGENARGPLRSYVGHAGEITDISVRLDGQAFISLSRDYSMCSWGVEAEQPQQSHEKLIESGQLALRPSRVAISPNGKTALIAFDGPQGGAYPISVSPNLGNPIRPDRQSRVPKRRAVKVAPAGISPDGSSVVVWDLDAWQRLSHVQLPAKLANEEVTDISWFADGQRTRLRTTAGTVFIYDRNQQQVDVHRARQKPLALCPTGTQWLLRSVENTVLIKDVRTGRDRMRLIPQGTQPSVAAFSEDGQRIVIGGTLAGNQDFSGGGTLAGNQDFSDGGTLAGNQDFSDGGTLAGNQDFSGGGTLAGNQNFSGGGTLAGNQNFSGGGTLAGNQDFNLSVFDASSGVELAKLSGLKSAPQRLVIAPQGGFVASISTDGVIRWWNIDAGTQVAELSASQAIFTPDGKHLVIWDENRFKMTVVTTVTGDSVASFAYEQALTCLRFVPNSSQFITGHQGGAIYAWELPEPAPESVSELASTAAFDEKPTEVSGVEPAVKIRDFGPTSIEQLAISTKGTIVAAVGSAPNVHLLDSRSGRVLRLLEGHEHPISALALSADGRYLLSGENQPGSQNVVRFWNNKSGKVIRTIELGELGVTKLALAPNVHSALLAKSDQSLVIWDLKNDALITEIKADGASVRFLGFTADGQRVVTLVDTILQCWDARSGTELMRYQNQQAPPNCVALGPSPSGVAVGTGSTGGNSGTILMVELDTGDVGQRFIGHENAVVHLAFSSDGSQLLSTAQDNSIRKWDVATGRQLDHLTDVAESVAMVGMCPKNSFVVVCPIEAVVSPAVESFENPSFGSFSNMSSDGPGKLSISLWGPPALAAEVKVAAAKSLAKAIDEIRSGQHHRIAMPPFRCVSFAADGRSAVCGGTDNRLRVVDIFKSEVVADLSGHPHPPDVIIVSPDGQQMLSADKTTALIWDPHDNSVQKKIKLGIDAQLTTLSPNGQRIAALTKGDGQKLAIKAFDLETAEELAYIELDQEPIALAFGTSGRQIISAFPNGFFIAWDAKTGKERKRTSAGGIGAAGDYANVQAITFSPSGKRAIVNHDGQAFTYFEIRSAKGRSFSPPPCDLASIVISQDGRRCLIPSTDGKLVLWDLVRKRELHSFACSPPPMVLAISPDGRVALSSNDYTSLVVWTLPE